MSSSPWATAGRAGVALALLCACTERQPSSQAERAQAREIVLSEAPKPQHPLDIAFEDKIRLLGYDLSAPAIREGAAFTITWYWQVNKPLGEGWKVFTHVADAKSQNRLNLDAVRPLRKLHPEPTWKAGEHLRDVQDITLPTSWDSEKAIFYLGFWNGPHRLHVTAGQHDGENRARALEVTVLDDSQAMSLPRMTARRVTSAPSLDGKLDEADWKAAKGSGDFVQTMTGAPGSFGARVRVLYDAEGLYLGYEVDDDYLKCTFEKQDDHLWEQDAIEVMLDPDGDGRNYFEIQVSPTGLSFDTRYDSRRRPQPFGDVAWSSATKAGVVTRGTVNDDDDDEGYVVEMAIPWSAFAAGSKKAAPPAKGAVWRMNFFVMDAREKGQRAVGWSPPLVGDFHTLQRFGEVVFPEAARPEAAATAPEPEGRAPTGAVPPSPP